MSNYGNSNGNTVTESQKRTETAQRTREAEQNAAGTSATSSTTTYHTEPGVHTLSAVDLEIIREEYENVLGTLNMVKARDIELAIGAGVETSGILDAIQQTAYAPRPSHYYLAAILRRYAASGIKTQAAAEAERVQRVQWMRERKHRQVMEWYHAPEDDYSW